MLHHHRGVRSLAALVAVSFIAVGCAASADRPVDVDTADYQPGEGRTGEAALAVNEVCLNACFEAMTVALAFSALTGPAAEVFGAAAFVTYLGCTAACNAG